MPTKPQPRNMLNAPALHGGSSSERRSDPPVLSSGLRATTLLDVDRRKRRMQLVKLSLAASSLVLACSATACSATIERDSPEAGTGSGGNTSIDAGGVGGSVASGGSGGTATGGAAMGGAAVGGSVNGEAGSGATGTGGSSTGGSGGGGVDPGSFALSAIPANATIGLDFPHVQGAVTYTAYWSNSSGVTPATGEPISNISPGFVHRGLTNGTPYYYVVQAELDGGGSALTIEASGTPNGEWVLEQLGTGDFIDIVTGGRSAPVPVEDRIHILLLPEGYQSGDLNAFHDHTEHDADRSNDVDRWVDEVFEKDPYSQFKEAFVVWYLPRASTAHMGEGDTAFDVTLSNGSVNGTSGAAAPLWAALDDQGADAFLFPPGEDVLNHVAGFLLFNASNGRAGFSGRTTSLENPSNSSQRIRAGFARGHAHEFTHAFAQVRDEYIENGGVGSSSETTNVASSNQCDELPWSHLLEGNGINTTPGLIGAFGTPERGYHSEFHCHMNGTHRNGEVWCSSGDERYPTDLNLRSDHLCNFCRELTAFRILEKTSVISSFEDWKSTYRAAFYERFGVFVPEDLPPSVSCNSGESEPIEFMACQP